jgi:hypothetical protein
MCISHSRSGFHTIDIGLTVPRFKRVYALVMGLRRCALPGSEPETLWRGVI